MSSCPIHRGKTKSSALEIKSAYRQAGSIVKRPGDLFTKLFLPGNHFLGNTWNGISVNALTHLAGLKPEYGEWTFKIRPLIAVIRW